MGSSVEPAWTALVLELPDSLADEAAGILGEGCLGVETTSVEAGVSKIRVYCSSRVHARRLLDAAGPKLRGLGLSSELRCATLEGVLDLRWAERYQRGLAPFPIGEGFVVVPGGLPHEGGERRPIVLVPGQAFGTGEHETTRLCVEALERWVRPGSRWLDLGTGTGILALVALYRGAAVEARDTDPDAVEVAREVFAANQAQERIRVEVGSGEDLAGAGLDGVVANVAAAFFLASAAEVRTLLRPGGVLLAAGLLRSEALQVADALANAGLDLLEELGSGEWALLAARRPAD